MAAPPDDAPALEPGAWPPVARAAIEHLQAQLEQARTEIARLTRRLAESEQLADRDALAPVLNRRAFLRELNRTAAFCARYETPAALVYFDLDGFKAVNDRYGHAAGDAALLAVAAILADNVRESDVVGRLGGDEFAVILANAEADAALIKTRSLVDLVEREPLVVAGRTLTLRMSGGVRAYAPDLTAAQWLAEADAAMFVRKRTAL